MEELIFAFVFNMKVGKRMTAKQTEQFLEKHGSSGRHGSTVVVRLHCYKKAMSVAGSDLLSMKCILPTDNSVLQGITELSLPAAEECDEPEEQPDLESAENDFACEDFDEGFDGIDGENQEEEEEHEFECIASVQVNGKTHWGKTPLEAKQNLPAWPGVGVYRNGSLKRWSATHPLATTVGYKHIRRSFGWHSLGLQGCATEQECLDSCLAWLHEVHAKALAA